MDAVLQLMELKIRAINEQTQMQQEYNNALIADIWANHAEEINSSEGYSAMEFPGILSREVSRYVDDENKDITQAYLSNDGLKYVLIVPKEKEELLKEIKSKVVNLVKSFYFNKDELSEFAGPGNKILSTDPSVLTDYQIYFLSSELADAGVKYSINKEGSISFLESDSFKFKRAIDNCAIRMSSDNYLNYRNEFGGKAALFKELSEKTDALSYGEAVYLSSDELTRREPNVYLRITDSSISKLILKTNSEGEVEYQEIEKKNIDGDKANLFAEINSLKTPVIFEPDLKNLSANRNDILDKIQKNYKQIDISKFEKDMISLLSDIGYKTHFTQEEDHLQTIENTIAEFSETDPQKGKQLQAKWQSVKNNGDPSAMIARYVNSKEFLTENVFEKAKPDIEFENQR